MNKKISDTYCKNEKKPGMHSIGNGLYLRVQVSRTDLNHITKSWLLRWGAGGKYTMGLGPYPAIGLAEARKLGAEAMQRVKLGFDPRAEREALREKVQLNQEALTFREASKKYIQKESPSWKNTKHTQQWTNTLETYALPVIGEKKCEEITLQHVMKVLEPIWISKNETATRIRSRMENIFDWAITHGHRKSANPARWKGLLEHTLTKISKRQRVRHHPALPYRDIPEFIQLIKVIDSISARALEFTILTGCRTGEVLGLKWEEIDFDNKTWIIPKERMKAGIEHRVPLSDQAIGLLVKIKKMSKSEYAFQNNIKIAKPISNMAMLMLLKRIKRHDITVHGFRSSFRDWGAEVTNHTREVMEHALAHKLADESEAAYQRSTFFEKRIALMSDWGKYCYGG
ncbi:site-specific integrase [Desulfobulbus sp.]|uniref:tyrosine-type recombinase/integrase n=1 Tax=Desulfobulbus sp. TaxID=895 RepID=UPI0027B8F621|nr:site-specific integrase [Desulfobulbus sp.]